MIPGMGETTIWGRSVEFLHLYVAMMFGGGGSNITLQNSYVIVCVKNNMQAPEHIFCFSKV